MFADMGSENTMTRQPHQKVPKVSVLMTIYNAGPYLNEAIDSIVAQTFSDWELIAVENGSSDESPAILHRYNDERIRTFFLPGNIGRTPALRYAFEQARGEYFAVLDADDVSQPDRLRKQVAHLDQYHEVGLVGTWAEQINERSEGVGFFKPPASASGLSDALGWSNPFVHSSIMYRANIAKRVGGYPAEYIYSQDYALILRVEKEAKVAMIAEPLCKWRVLETSMTRSQKYGLIIAKELFLLGKSAGQRHFYLKNSHNIFRHRQAVNQLKFGISLLMNKGLFEGFSLVIKAIVTRPSCLIFNGYIKALAGNITWRIGKSK